jgi:hypothetical protein
VRGCSVNSLETPRNGRIKREETNSVQSYFSGQVLDSIKRLPAKKLQALEAHLVLAEMEAVGLCRVEEDVAERLAGFGSVPTSHWPINDQQEMGEQKAIPPTLYRVFGGVKCLILLKIYPRVSFFTIIESSFQVC